MESIPSAFTVTNSVIRNPPIPPSHYGDTVPTLDLDLEIGWVDLEVLPALDQTAAAEQHDHDQDPNPEQELQPGINRIQSRDRDSHDSRDSRENPGGRSPNRRSPRRQRQQHVLYHMPRQQFQTWRQQQRQQPSVCPSPQNVSSSSLPSSGGHTARTTGTAATVMTAVTLAPPAHTVELDTDLVSNLESRESHYSGTVGFGDSMGTSGETLPRVLSDEAMGAQYPRLDISRPGTPKAQATPKRTRVIMELSKESGATSHATALTPAACSVPSGNVSRFMAFQSGLGQRIASRATHVNISAALVGSGVGLGGARGMGPASSDRSSWPQVKSDTENTHGTRVSHYASNLTRESSSTVPGQSFPPIDSSIGITDFYSFQTRGRTASTSRSLLGLGQIGTFGGSPASVRLWSKVRAWSVFACNAGICLSPLFRADVGTLLHCTRDELRYQVIMGFDMVMTTSITFLVMLLELRWWRTSSSILVVRWHILANCVVAMLLTQMSTWPQTSCPKDTVDINRAAWCFCLTAQWCTFIWNDHLIHERVVQLEKASGKPLGSRILRWVVLSNFLLSVVSLPLLVGLWWHFGDWQLQPVGIALAVGIFATVLTSLVTAARAFWLALKLALQEVKECMDAVEEDIAKYAVSVARKHLAGVTVSMAMALPVAVCEICMVTSAQRLDRTQLALHVAVMLNAFCNIVCVALLSGLLDSVDLWSIVAGGLATSSTPPPPRDCRCLDNWKTDNSQWDEEVKKLAKRGFTLRALLKFYASLGTSSGPMPEFDPKAHTTNDVARQAIIPLSHNTKFGDCALATVMMNGKETLPSKLVTHTWKNLFAHLVAAIVADALRIPMYEHILSRLEPKEISTLISELYWKSKLDSTYWVCAFSINQHASICHLPGGKDPKTDLAHPLCPCLTPKDDYAAGVRLSDGRLITSEINKFDDMMDCLATTLPKGSFGQVIAVDQTFELFERAWCIAEIHRANQMELPQTMVLLSEQCWESHRQELRGLRVEHMKATNPADKDAILDKIPDKEAFNKELDRMVFDEKGLLRAWQDGLDIVCMLGKVLKMSEDNQKMMPRVSRRNPTIFWRSTH